MKANTTRARQKVASRAKIMKSASALFAHQGIQSTGIDQIMKKAGLTAGAFYAHFKSKDHLVQEVLWAALPLQRNIPAEDFLDYYLSEKHRDHPETSGPLATFGSDLARADRKLRLSIARQMEKAIKSRPDNTSPAAQKRALQILSAAVGALILARITRDTELSDQFLNCYR